MLRSINSAVSGMITLEGRQDTITNNLANMNTTGFKKDTVIAKDFGDVLIQNYSKIVDGRNQRTVLGKLSLGSKIDDVSTDFTQGNIQDTKNWTDFAIQGRGFFAVRSAAQNSTMYTRDGHFLVNEQGYLTTDSGDEVLGQNLSTGNLEHIYVGNDKAQVDGQGNMIINGKNTYKLQTFDFANYNSLKKVGDNLYSGTGATPTTASTQIKQSALESSNINIINEMVNMMTVMRSFQTNQTVLQSIDETLNKTVNDLGSVR